MEEGAEKVPPFNKDGVLPDGIYDCGEELLKTRFVSQFPNSSTRDMICNGFLDYRGEVNCVVEAAIQWVDGSFVTEKLDPRDVDVITFCDYEYFSTASGNQQKAIMDLLNAKEGTKAEYSTHSFFVPVCSPEHPFYSKYEDVRHYWRKQLGRTKTIRLPSGEIVKRSRRKGFLKMILGDPDEAPIICSERRKQCPPSR